MVPEPSDRPRSRRWSASVTDLEPATTVRRHHCPAICRALVSPGLAVLVHEMLFAQKHDFAAAIELDTHLVPAALNHLALLAVQLGVTQYALDRHAPLLSLAAPGPVWPQHGKATRRAHRSV